MGNICFLIAVIHLERVKFDASCIIIKRASMSTSLKQRYAKESVGNEDDFSIKGTGNAGIHNEEIDWSVNAGATQNLGSQIPYNAINDDDLRAFEFISKAGSLQQI